MRVVVAGGGLIGRELSDRLIREGNDVILVEKDAKRAEDVAAETDTLVIHGDCTDKEILEDADVERSDVFFALTGDDRTNLAACELVRKMGVEKTIARVNDEHSEELFLKAGVNSFVNPTHLAVTALRDALENEAIGRCSLCSGFGDVVELDIHKDSLLKGKHYSRLGVPGTVLCARRGKRSFVPDVNEIVRDKDKLAMFVHSSDLPGFREKLFGDGK